MKLFVGGYDIRYLILGDIDDQDVTRFECSPDEYLAKIVQFLEAKGASISDLSEIHAVLGPGSATALRASLSIVNTLSYALQVPVSGYNLPENWDESSLSDIIKVIEAQADWPLMPAYQNAPRITLSNKDQLKR